MLAEFLKDYLSIILFLVIALGLSMAFVAINYLASPKKPDPEKLSAYECGFEPFNDSRMEFDVRFYLVAILFIIFDLEIAFLFPWAISLGKIGLFGFVSMMIFLFILTVGFIYEWNKIYCTRRGGLHDKKCTTSIKAFITNIYKRCKILFNL